MVNHTCANCNKSFAQKIHLDNHKKRKRPCKPGETRIVSSRTVASRTVASRSIETLPLSWYAENMSEIFSFVTKQIHGKVSRGETYIIVPAQVKTGKRYIAQAYSAFTTPIAGEKTAHVFISSWVRRDDDNQRKVLNAYFQGTPTDPRVFKINTEKSRLRCIQKLKDIVAKHDKTIVHLDELDYGSGSEQHMAAVYEYCMNQEKITLICYSASYEEATIDPIMNTFQARKPVILPFTPPDEYRGAKWLCDNGLAHDAKPFFNIVGEDITLSDSAKELLQRAKDRLSSPDPKVSRRKLLIIRQTVAFERIKDLIDASEFPELCGTDDLRILPHFIHSRKEVSTMTVKWDDYNWWKRQIEVERGGGKFLLILFIDQSSTRSTDWFCHPWLSVYHDYHPPDTPSNTCIQSNLRGVYYTNKRCEGVKVYMDEEFFPEIHGQKDVIEYVAGLKKLGEISRPVSSRTKVFEQLKTFGPIMTARFTAAEMAALPIEGRLTDQMRSALQTAILEKLKPAERRMLGERSLHSKRAYGADFVDEGGIYGAAINKLRGINSAPVRNGGSAVGGGIGGELYNTRGNYFWADFATADLETTYDGQVIKIPKGTVYITHGIADPIVDDDDDASTVSDNVHRVTKKSMYH